MLVWDGAPAHRAKKLRIATGISLANFPAYTPQFNPVERFSEQLWSELEFGVFESSGKAEYYPTKILEKHFKQIEFFILKTQFPIKSGTEEDRISAAENNSALFCASER